jgi:hypothetical protein
MTLPGARSCWPATGPPGPARPVRCGAFPSSLRPGEVMAWRGLTTARGWASSSGSSWPAIRLCRRLGLRSGKGPDKRPGNDEVRTARPDRASLRRLTSAVTGATQVTSDPAHLAPVRPSADPQPRPGAPVDPPRRPGNTRRRARAARVSDTTRCGLTGKLSSAAPRASSAATTPPAQENHRVIGPRSLVVIGDTDTSRESVHADILARVHRWPEQQVSGCRRNASLQPVGETPRTRDAIHAIRPAEVDASYDVEVGVQADLSATLDALAQMRLRLGPPPPGRQARSVIRCMHRYSPAIWPRSALLAKRPPLPARALPPAGSNSCSS